MEKYDRYDRALLLLCCLQQPLNCEVNVNVIDTETVHVSKVRYDNGRYFGKMGFVSSHLKLHTDAEFNVQWSEIASSSSEWVLEGCLFFVFWCRGGRPARGSDDGDDEAKCYWNSVLCGFSAELGWQ